MQKNQVIAVALLALAVGLAGGYGLAEMGEQRMNEQADVSQQTTTQATHTMTTEEMMASMAAKLEGKTGEEFDRVFLEEMIIHHEGALLMAEAGVKNGKSEQVQNLSRAIRTTQTAEIAKMKTWLESWYPKQ